MTSIENPWLSLPDEPPFIAPADRAQFADDAAELYGLKTQLMPHVLIGDPTRAAALLLLGNPGYAERDVADEVERPQYRQIIRKVLCLEEPDAFWPLRPELTGTSAADWWHGKLRSLTSAVGQDAIRQRLAVLEYFPYHSVSDTAPPLLPSQRFAFGLVRDALGRGATIIVMRKARAWAAALSELERYPRVFWNPHAHPQQAAVSPRNIGADAFQALVAAVRPPNQ